MSILTAKEAAGVLRCGLSTVYELFASGLLTGFRIRRGVRIYADSVYAFMLRNANLPAPLPEPKQEPVKPAAKPRRKLKPSGPTILRPPG